MAISEVSEVAHFPDHDDVRIAAQNAAERGREGEIDLGLDRDLHHAGELVLDGIFDRHNAALHRVEHGKKGVERGALAAAGRAGEQDDAVGLRNQIANFALGDGGEAEQGKIEAVAREKPQADALAADGGNGGDADVDGLAFHFEIDAAVLRHAALGDVEIGHDLDAGEHARLKHLDLRRHGNFVKHAVDAIPDAQIVLERLDVNVRRAFVEGRAHDLIDKADHGRLGILLVEDVDFLLQVERRVVDIAAFQDGVEGLRADAVAGTQRGEDGPAGGDAPGDRLLDFLRDDLPRGEIERIVGEKVKVVVVEADGVEIVAEGEARGKLLAQFFVHRRQRVFPPRQAEFGANFAEEIVFRDQLFFQQGADGGGLLNQAGIDGFRDRRLVAEARFESESLEDGAGHALILLWKEGESQLFSGWCDFTGKHDGQVFVPE